MQMSLVSLMPIADVSFRDRLAGADVATTSLDLRSRWDPRAFARAPKAIGTHDPDVIHSHLKHADLVAGYSARMLERPHVSTLHLVEQTSTVAGALKRWSAVRMRERSASRVIAVSDAVRDWYLELADADPDSVVRIYNGVRRPDPVSDDDLARIRNELRIDDGRPVIACVSLMRPEKGHEDLLDAIARQRRRDALYLLAGDGPRRPALEAQAAAIGLGPDRVRFLGFRDDVEALLAVSDMVVQPSREDALPTSLIQALAAGLPAVATTVGGIPEIITNDLGFLVPPGDTAALSQALDAAPDLLIGLPEIAVSARDRFDRHFEASRWAGTLSDLYDEVVAEHSAPVPGSSG